MILYRVVLIVLLLLALWRYRWAYVGFALLGLIYFPLTAGFPLTPKACEMIPGVQLALYSFRNYPHIVGFGIFFVLSYIQFRGTGDRARVAWAVLATLTMGALVELAEGMSGLGHCRMRDLIPDAAGALLGAGCVLLWNVARKQAHTSRSSLG